jgi:hypothetical protein
MTREERKKKINELLTRRLGVLSEIIGPARAAFNAMKDAKMDRSAEPLGELLFKYDSIDAEIHNLIHEDPETIFELMQDHLKDLGG